MKGRGQGTQHEAAVEAALLGRRFALRGGGGHLGRRRVLRGGGNGTWSSYYVVANRLQLVTCS